MNMMGTPYGGYGNSYPSYNNPYNNYNQFQSQQAQQNLIRVNGIDGARAYQMTANSTVALFDANDDLMYVKSTDGAGFPSIRIFRFCEESAEAKQAQTTDFVSREEFNQLKKEVSDYVKQSIQKQSAE